MFEYEKRSIPPGIASFLFLYERLKIDHFASCSFILQSEQSWVSYRNIVYFADPKQIKMKKTEVDRITGSVPSASLLTMSADQGVIFKLDWSGFIQEHFSKL